MARGQFEAALAAIQERVGELGIDNLLEKEAVVSAVDAALLAGKDADAEELLDMIDGLQPGELTPYLRAQSSLLRGRLEAIRGNRKTVEGRFKTAAGLFRELSMPFFVGETLLEHAEWLTGEGRGAEALQLAEEAREIFERLGARPWLERLSKVSPVSERVGA
jgi:hypothetical protein